MKHSALLFLLLFSLTVDAQVSFVKDLAAGASGSTISPGIAQIDGILYFSADDGSTGKELWRSDGSRAGTYVVKDINAAGGSGADNLIVANGKLYFTADDGTGKAFWVSDGTNAGTTKIAGGITVVSGSGRVALVGTTIFFAGVGGGDTELYKLDTGSNTVSLVKNINPGGNSGPTSLYNFNGTLVFGATDGSSGVELWKSDGTAGNTVQVKDIRSGTSGSTPLNFIAYNGKVYFTATDGSTGFELWVSDLTSGGTTQVKDIRPGSTSSTPQRFIVYNGLLYFVANDGGGNKLWQTDGTGGNTVKVATSPDDPKNFVVFNNQLFFQGSSAGDAEFWKLSAGTCSLVKDLDGASSSTPSNLMVAGGSLYFNATIGTTDTKLYRSDGTTAGTVVVEELSAGDDATVLLGVVNNSLYLVGDNGSTGTELYAVLAPALPPNGTLALNDGNSAVGNGTESGWSFYMYKSNIVFSVKWGASTSAKNIANISLVQGSMTSKTNATANATYAMGRYWNVDVGGTALTENAGLRFYYDPAEKTAVVNAAQSFATTNSVPFAPFKWFKTIGAAYDPATDVTAGGVNGPITELAGTESSISGSLSVVEFSGIPSFSGGSGAAGAGVASPLPVELLFFKAELATNNQVRLSWATAREWNSSHYIVERSRDLQTYAKIGMLDAKGLTSTRQDYYLIDQNPPLGTSYYRLRQVDRDGKEQLYKPVSIVLTESGLPLAVYPNPSKGQFSIRVDDADISRVTIQNTSGQTWSVPFRKAGAQVLESKEKLPPGTYLIEVKNGITSVVHKLLVQE